MSKTKNFDRNEDGNLISATKLYINSKTYEIENQEMNDNFAVDTLIAETISILNKKGYKTICSNAGHVYHYFLRHFWYKEEELINNGDKQYLIVGYHGDLDGSAFPVKYELVSRDSKEFAEYIETHKNISFETSGDDKINVFRVMFPIIIISIKFNKPYDFFDLPHDFFSQDIVVRQFEGRTKDYSQIQEIMSRIDYDFEEFNEEMLLKEIEKKNNDLLLWTKDLPICDS